MFSFISKMIGVLSLLISLNQETARITTPLSEKELMYELNESYVSVFQTKPTKEELKIAWAQISFENGRGKKIYNNNFGNIGASQKELHYKLGPAMFKSNPSPREGAKKYWEHLRKKCPNTLKNFKSGNTKVVSQGLKSCGYYRTSVEHYSENLSSLASTAQKHMSM